MSELPKKLAAKRDGLNNWRSGYERSFNDGFDTCYTEAVVPLLEIINNGCTCCAFDNDHDLCEVCEAIKKVTGSTVPLNETGHWGDITPDEGR